MILEYMGGGHSVYIYSSIKFMCGVPKDMLPSLAVYQGDTLRVARVVLAVPVEQHSRARSMKAQPIKREGQQARVYV